jgi:septal ring factor EnvC (AmiA/AmiB activator)
MIEALIPLAIATVAAGATLNSRLHQRINNVHDRIGGLDRRIDQVELSVAQDYVTKADLQAMIDRVEAHMVRIENKLDQIALKSS